MRSTRRTPNDRSGFTVTEILFATTLMAVIMLASFMMMEKDTKLQKSTLSISYAEKKAQTMLFKLERELADARGESPSTTLELSLPGGSTQVEVTSTLGFPNQGILLIDRGNGAREFVSYTGLGGLNSFTGATRGLQCTEPGVHADGADVMWAGLAEPLALQINPPANTWDGIALEPTGQLFFRGAGIGFSYRVPTDETGGTDYLDGDDVQWGEVVTGVPTLDGWGAVYWNPVWVYDESRTGEDVNRDGDSNDQFDVGQLRRRTWDTSNVGNPGSDFGLGPTAILQEQCAWGSDLDGDGFEDPIFLWNENDRTLHIRIFVIGTSVQDMPIVRRVESVIFMRNEPGLGGA